MAINAQRAVVGGIAAAVTLVVLDFVAYGNLLKDRMSAAADAFKPGLGEIMNSPNAIIVYIICDLVMGLLLVWTYAAIRPRYGPGAGTAMRVGFLFWAIASVIQVPFLLMGMYTMSFWWTLAIVFLIEIMIAAMVGASLYREDTAPATA